MKLGLRLETIKKRAEVRMADGSHMSGSFFVSPESSISIGEETIYEILTGDRSYLPFEKDDGGVALLQKGSIEMIRLMERELDKDLPFHREIYARIFFLSGEAIEGFVFSDLPKSYLRLSDYVNLSKEFFYIQVGADDYLINSRWVKLLEPGGNG